MRATWAIAALGLLLVLPGASACLTQTTGAGTVAPLLDLQFPEKQKCKQPDHSDCTKAPTADEAFEMDGTLVWEWAVDQCEATNVAFSADPIIISFPPFPRNPSWLKLSVEPAEVEVSFEDQWDLLDDQIDPTTQTFIMRETYPIKVRVERIGDPTPEEQDRIDVKNGVVEVYAKAVSSQTQGFQPGFAFENFRFDASAWTASEGVNETNDVPAPSFAFLALGLAALALGARRLR